MNLDIELLRRVHARCPFSRVQLFETLWTVAQFHLWLSSKESTCNAGDKTQDTQVRFLGRGDSLEREVILVWKIPWTEEPGGLQYIGSKEPDTTKITEHTHTEGLQPARLPCPWDSSGKKL